MSIISYFTVCFLPLWTLIFINPILLAASRKSAESVYGTGETIFWAPNKGAPAKTQSTRNVFGAL